MKKRLLIALILVLALSLSASLAWAAATRVVTPTFQDHQGEESSFDPASMEFSTDETILGANSVKMVIPSGAIPEDRWGLGLNVETRHATGMSRQRGLAFYEGISFKAYFEDPPFDPDPTDHAPLYLSIILYDRTNEVWVSMIPTCGLYVCWGGASMNFSDLDAWKTATPDESGLWTGWTFGGDPWLADEEFPWGGLIPKLMTLSEWDEYIDANSLDVKVRKVNIQFGYRPPLVHQDWDGDGIPEPHSLGVDYGTVYVDELSFGGRTLDFEPGQ